VPGSGPGDGASPEASPGRFRPRLRLAVLPLANLGPEPRYDCFNGGRTEELISRLSKFLGLGVIARTSGRHDKGATKTVAELTGRLELTSAPARIFAAPWDLPNEPRAVPPSAAPNLT